MIDFKFTILGSALRPRLLSSVASGGTERGRRKGVREKIVNVDVAGARLVEADTAGVFVVVLGVGVNFGGKT